RLPRAVRVLDQRAASLLLHAAHRRGGEPAEQRHENGASGGELGPERQRPAALRIQDHEATRVAKAEHLLLPAMRHDEMRVLTPLLARDAGADFASALEHAEATWRQLFLLAGRGVRIDVEVAHPRALGGAPRD